MSAHESLVRRAPSSCPGPPESTPGPRCPQAEGRWQSVVPSSLRRAHKAPAAPAKEGPFRRGLLLSAWSASARGLGQQAPSPVPQPHPGPLALAQPPGPRTGSQVPLVEVLQLNGTLPLTLLSWSLLHTGGHRVGPTWGQTDGLGAQPWPRADHRAHGPWSPSLHSRQVSPAPDAQGQGPSPSYLS